MEQQYDPARIIENIMDGVRAATDATRRTDHNIEDARAMLDEIASELPLIEQGRFWRAINGTTSARMRSLAMLTGNMLTGKQSAWTGHLCERDIEERRIEEADAAEVAREAKGDGG